MADMKSSRKLVGMAEKKAKWCIILINDNVCDSETVWEREWEEDDRTSSAKLMNITNQETTNKRHSTDESFVVVVREMCEEDEEVGQSEMS